MKTEDARRIITEMARRESIPAARALRILEDMGISSAEKRVCVVRDIIINSNLTIDDEGMLAVSEDKD